MAKKIAEQLIDTLVKSGVERIYAVTGDSLNEVNEAVRKNDQIKWIHVRHEETGAYAAAAEAQLTGRPGCCAGSSGPGHVHLINGLYDAHRSGAPVIAIASTIPTGEFGTEYFQETNTIKLFNDCSYYNEVATTPTQFPRMLQSAIQTAVTRKGVSVIGLPGDLAKASAVTVDSSVINYPAPPEVCPSEEDLAQLADMLNKHTRITLFCGIGCRGAHEEVIALSEKLNAPVVYTFKGKMEVQYENPYEVGMTGLLGMPSGYYSMHEAEVLLMLGTDFPYSAFLPDDIKIAQIDIKPERLGRRAKVDIGLCGDVKLSIQSLLRMLNPKTDDSFLLKQLKRYEGVKKDLAAYTEDKGDVNKIHPEYVMSEIDKLSSDDAVFTVDTGMTCVWGARYLQATGKRHMLGSFNHGSMANALPQAIGAALAYPDRQVVALCGDGGLSMTLGDLETVVQYKLPIKIIVFNNRSLGMVKLEMEVDGLPDWQTNMLNPDFAQVAEAMGMTGFNVSDPEEVLTTLLNAFELDGPVLVNIMTDPNALAMPPKIEFGQMVGFAQSMYKLLINGRSQEVIDLNSATVSINRLSDSKLSLWCLGALFDCCISRDKPFHPLTPPSDLRQYAVENRQEIRISQSLY